LDAFPAFAAIRDIPVVQSSKMRRDAIVDCVRGPYRVFPEGGIYRFGERLAPELPFTANVYQWFFRLACTMKRNDEPGLGQHARQRRFIKIGARDVQGFLSGLPEKTCELIPCPSTQLRYGPHDFR
jgi:hypothetical protein